MTKENQTKKLLEAVRWGKSADVIASITAGADVNATDELGRTALVIVAETTDIFQDQSYEIFETLIAASANVNIRRIKEWPNGQISAYTALERVLVCSANIEIVKLLIAAGADVNANPNYISDAIPLLSMIDTYRPQANKLISILIAAGADVNEDWAKVSHDKTVKNGTMLHFAVESDEPSTVITIAQLLQAGAKIPKNLIDSKSKLIQQQLLLAQNLIKSCENLITDLETNLKDLKHDLDLDVLAWAAKFYAPESTAIIPQLVQMIAAENSSDSSPKLPALISAILLNNQDTMAMARILIAAGANIEKTDEYGKTILMYAVHADHAQADEIVKLLLDAGVNINLHDQHGLTVLMYAVTSNNPKAYAIVRTLIHAYADINASTPDQQTAIDFAAESSHPEIHKIIALLIEGYPIQVQTKLKIVKGSISENSAQHKNIIAAKNFIKATSDLWDAIDIAEKTGDLTGIKNAIANGVDLDRQNNMSTTDFMAIVCNHNPGPHDDDIIAELLKSKPSLTQCDYLSQNALDYAVRCNNSEVVKMLIAAGADVNAKNRYHENILMNLDFENKHTCEIVKILLAAGIDVNAPNKSGSTALGRALNSRHEAMSTEVLALLIQAGAKIPKNLNNSEKAKIVAAQKLLAMRSN